MFRASSAHLQEVNDVNCTCIQPLVFCMKKRLVVDCLCCWLPDHVFREICRFRVLYAHPGKGAA